jgi:hypothetical protein
MTGQGPIVAGTTADSTLSSAQTGTTGLAVACSSSRHLSRRTCHPSPACTARPPRYSRSSARRTASGSSPESSALPCSTRADRTTPISAKLHRLRGLREHTAARRDRYAALAAGLCPDDVQRTALWAKHQRLTTEHQRICSRIRQLNKTLAWSAARWTQTTPSPWAPPASTWKIWPPCKHAADEPDRRAVILVSPIFAGPNAKRCPRLAFTPVLPVEPIFVSNSGRTVPPQDMAPQGVGTNTRT